MQYAFEICVGRQKPLISLVPEVPINCKQKIRVFDAIIINDLYHPIVLHLFQTIVIL